MMNESEANDLLVELGEAIKEPVVSDFGQFNDNDNFYEAMSESGWKSARLSSSNSDDIGNLDDAIRVKELEEEQERLNNSLYSLSSHFAQVQFRIKQMNEADPQDKETMLKDLEEFAFRGCTDMNELQRLRSESEDTSEVLEKQNKRQKELLRQLREQVEDLERAAYENGDGELPSFEILSKQKAVLDKLREKTELNLDMDKMTQIEIQKHVDNALKQLVNPFKEKGQLVDQLQTQITDLERFVTFLQNENTENSNETTPVKSMGSTPLSGARAKNSSFLGGILGYSTTKFQKNQLKNTLKGNHYGDERALVQLAVETTKDVLKKYTLLTFDFASKEQLEEVNVNNDALFERSDEEVVTVVRKTLCPALKALLEHGMLKETLVQKRIPGLGCFVAKNTTHEKTITLDHVWDVIIFFFNLKTGKDTTDAPVRMLSQSFKLDNVGGKCVTSKQLLLTTIENIISTHARLKRSKDAHWKAFISAAMNERKLPAWLRIVFRTKQVTEMCYSSWSYVSRTGCEELYSLLEDLHEYNINLPVDLALRPFEQIKDAF